MMPDVLVTCCCFTLLQMSPKRRRHPEVYSLNKGSDSENPPVCPACVLLCHSAQKEIRNRHAASGPGVIWLLRVTPRFPSEAFQAIYAKSSLQHLCNHQKKPKKTKTPQQTLWFRDECRKQAPDGCGHSRGPVLGFQVHPQCSPLVLRRIREDTISISDRSISIQFVDPYLHNLDGSSLRRGPRDFASNVHTETNLQILGEL